MEDKIQLSHPAGKHAIKIDKQRYQLLKDALIKGLSGGALTHKELYQAVTNEFKRHNISFEGSVEWYMESVKLDLEAKSIIRRIKEKSKLKFELIKE